MLKNTLQYAYGTALVAVLGMTFYSCSQENSPPVDTSTWGIIQRQIITPNCATSGCHLSTQDASFKQHELVLEKSVAYQNLVNAKPKNTNALADNLLRVKPFKSLESLLYHKLHTETGHHSHDYGNPMPLGGKTLTEGEIEFIRRWIEAGSPQTGSVVDEAVLKDTSRLVIPPFEGLAPPPAGKGIQVGLSPFQIAPNYEREFFIYKKLNNATGMYVNRMEIKMRNSSHHFLFYSFQDNTPASALPKFDEFRDLRNTDGTLNVSVFTSMQYHVFAGGSQSPYLDFTLPDSTALYIPPNFALDFNSHYVNKTSSPIIGEVVANFYTVPQNQVKYVLKTLNWGNQDVLFLPANQKSTITKTFTVKKRTQIVTLTSHMHALGEKFVIKIKGGRRDGEIVYTSTDWEHPPQINYKEPIILNVGEGLTSEITYNNNKPKPISFGFTSEDEMGIIFGYYYEF
jgi:hypothetical protein